MMTPAQELNAYISTNYSQDHCHHIVEDVYCTESHAWKTQKRPPTKVDALPISEVSVNKLTWLMCRSAYDCVIPAAEGEVLRMAWDRFPTMCGGKVLNFYRTDLKDFSNQKMWTFTDSTPTEEKVVTPGDVRGRFADKYAGILAFVINWGEHNHLADAVVGKFLEAGKGLSGYSYARTSHVTAEGKETIVYLAQLADMDEHDKAESGQTVDTCDWCGEYLDGYSICPECGTEAEEYFMEDDEFIETHNREGWIAALETDGWDGEDRIPFLHLSSFDKYGTNYLTNAHLYGRIFNHQAVPDGETPIPCPATSWEGLSNDEKVVAFIAWTCLIRRDTPLFLSSNVGKNDHSTPLIMSVLHNNPDMLADYGIKATFTEGLATNPNESYHFIDSVCVTRAGE